MLSFVSIVPLSLIAPPPRTSIVGAGPAGLATAIGLAKRGWPDITVYDRLGPPPALDDDKVWDDTARFYLIGIGGRGQRALRKIGAWDALEPYTAVVRGRKDWAPGAGVDGGIETIRADRPPSNVIQRDRLVASLLDQAKSLGVTIKHETDVAGISWAENDDAILQCSPCGDECALDVEGGKEYTGSFEVRSPFVVGSDGVRRTICSAIEAEDEGASGFRLPWRKFKVTKYEDTSVRVYKTVPFKPPDDWRCDINYSARTSRFNFDALPSPVGKAPEDKASDGADVSSYCGVLLIKPDEKSLDNKHSSLEDARSYFDELLPQFSPFIDDKALQAVLDKPPSRLPVFRYAGPRLYRGSSTVLLGDAIHSVKPYFGLGVNSAFEDVAVLLEELDQQEELSTALKKYSNRRSAEARILVQMSRSFDRAGFRGFLSFIGPIILDGIFGSLPLIGKAFGPNTLAMLQQPTTPFATIRWRKRADRFVQLALLGTALTLMARLAFASLVAAARVVTTTLVPLAIARPRLLALPTLLAAAAAFAIKQRALSEPELIEVGKGGGRVVRGAMRGGDVADVLATQVKKDGTGGVEQGTRRGY